VAFYISFLRTLTSESLLLCLHGQITYFSVLFFMVVSQDRHTFRDQKCKKIVVRKKSRKKIYKGKEDSSIVIFTWKEMSSVLKL